MIATPPFGIGEYECDIDEFCFVQYMPVKMAGSWDVLIPESLQPATKIVEEAYEKYHWATIDQDSDHAPHPCTLAYIYLTVKRGFATTESPLNRPGWHVDAFGHPEDFNYVWCDKFPTRYVTGDIGEVPEDDAGALEVFEDVGTLAQAHHDYAPMLSLFRNYEPSLALHHVNPGELYYFGQDVVHTTPIIDNPGLRTFVKVSISPHKYNLKGNAHNYLFDYEWEMFDREEVRNDPVKGNGDFV